MANLGTWKAVRILSWFLRSIGISFASPNNAAPPLRASFRFLMFLTNMLIIGLTSVAYGYVNRRDFKKSVTIAGFLGASTIYILILLRLFVQRNHIENILTQIDRNLYVYSDEEHIPIDSSWLVLDAFHKRKLFYIYGVVVLGYSLEGFSVLLDYALSGEFTIIRFYPAWYPWNDQYVGAGQMLTNCAQFAALIYAFWITVTLNTLIFYFTTEFLRQKDRLCAALSSLHHRTCKILDRDRVCSVSARRGITYNVVYREQMTECFVHYRKILE